ncbi:MAG: hypothetical protein ACT4QB_07945 [Gammaproteobacteria bacterium]
MSGRKRLSKPIASAGRHPPFPRRTDLWMALGLTALSPDMALAAFPANLNLADLNGTNGFRLAGVAARDLAGEVVAAAGDVNGDGMDDLLIGARIDRSPPPPPPPADPPMRFDGAVYVVFGGRDVGSSGNLELSALDGTNGFEISPVTDAATSSQASAAGDINGDGMDDLLLGARNATPNGGSSGESYVVFGGAGVGAGGNLQLEALNGTNGFRIPGLASPDSVGFAVSTAGDVNVDGVPDLLIGAGGASPGGRSLAGASYVVFGGAGVGRSGTFNLAALDGTNGFQLSGVAAGDLSGRAVNTAGDVNGDGIPDLLIGAYGASPNGRFRAGASYVVFGGAGVGAGGNIELSALNGTNGFKLSGVRGGDASIPEFGDFSGFALSTAGDFNGDRVDDLLIGARYADPNQRGRAGESYVVFGGAGVGAGGNIELSALDGTNGFRILAAAAYDLLGNTVSAVGDVNGDRMDDILIGAGDADPNGDISGASYVIFGGAGVGSGGTLDLSSPLDGTNGFRISGVAALDRSGLAVSAAGDVNGDGAPDLLIGAPYASPNGLNSGASYVVFGQPPPPPPPPDPITSSSPSVSDADTEPLALSDPRPFGCELEGEEITCVETGDTTPFIVFDVDIPAEAFFLQFEYTFTGGDGQIPSAGGAETSASFPGQRGPGAAVGDLGAVFISNAPIAALPASTVSRPGMFQPSGQFQLSASGTSTMSIVNYPSGGTGSVFRVRNLRVDRCKEPCSGMRATICGTEGRDLQLTGTPRNDVIAGRGGGDIIRGGGGNDLICGGQGNDRLVGGGGRDTLLGGLGRDKLRGGAGNDTLRGDEGRDRLVGGKGRDTLRGGEGADRLLGGPGNDRMNGGLGRDVCDGGPGHDAARRCESTIAIP